MLIDHIKGFSEVYKQRTKPLVSRQAIRLSISLTSAIAAVLLSKARLTLLYEFVFIQIHYCVCLCAFKNKMEIIGNIEIGL